MPQPEDVLTPKQAAEILGVSVSAVVMWADRGRLRSYRTLGGHRRLFRSDVEAVAAAQFTERPDATPPADRAAS